MLHSKKKKKKKKFLWYQESKSSVSSILCLFFTSFIPSLFSCFEFLTKSTKMRERKWNSSSSFLCFSVAFDCTFTLGFHHETCDGFSSWETKSWCLRQDFLHFWRECVFFPVKVPSIPFHSWCKNTSRSSSRFCFQRTSSLSLFFSLFFFPLFLSSCFDQKAKQKNCKVKCLHEMVKKVWHTLKYTR